MLCEVEIAALRHQNQASPEYRAYQDRIKERALVVSINKSRRMKNHFLKSTEKLEILLVPELLPVPMVKIAYDESGTYQGQVCAGDVIPADWVIKLEKEL